MSEAYYPSDEYDSSELEQEAAIARAQYQLRHWPTLRRRNDDDDDSPPTPVAARLPRPLPPLVDVAAEAA